MNRSASYVHALNGRLRIKLPELKGNPMRAQEIENQFNLMTGMQQVSANPVTGSLLFIYDPHLLKQEEICAVLRELGYFRDHSGRPDFFPGFGLRHSRGGGKNHHHAGLRSHGDSLDPPGGGAYLKKKQTRTAAITRSTFSGISQEIALYSLNPPACRGATSLFPLLPHLDRTMLHEWP